MAVRAAIRPACTALVVLALAGCAPSDDVAGQVPPEAETATLGAPPEGVVTAQGCEPRSLVPPRVAQECGRHIADALFTGLVEYAPDTWRPRWGTDADRAMARAITSPDARRWTIRLEEGWTFHDGEPVTAGSFAVAWSHAAYGPNAHPHAPLFAPIEGFEDLQCDEAQCDEGSLARVLSGVRVVNEHTLEVTLSEPRRTFPWLLGHIAFSPLPRAAFEDPEAYGEQPVGNGPFRMDGAWEHDRVIRLERFEDYAGEPAGSDGLEVRITDTPEAAWEAFLGGDLDIVDDLPPDRVQEARRRFVRRFVQQPGSHSTFLVAPAHVPSLTDDQLVRALSMAVDRRRIIQQHLHGTAVPARSLVPPAIAPAGAEDRCGDGCRHHPERARRLLVDAGGIPDGGLTLWYPESAEYEPWLRAIADQWVAAFALPPEVIRLQPLPFTEFLAHVEDRRVDGPYRMGWLMDVPSPRDYLQPMHGEGGLLNLDGYRNPLAQRLIERADAAGSLPVSLDLYDAAVAALLRDWHHIPLWFELHQAVHSERVGGVQLDPFGRVRLADVTAVEPDEDTQS